MEFNTLGSEKSKNESVRVPSPASVSSVHSIRPLEWDSGADIGYEFKHQPGLSTVERIALKSGTLNLLESCISRDTSTNYSYPKRCIGNPLAQSSPFIAPSELTKTDRSSRSTNDNLSRPLVNYTISEYSFEEEVEKLESEVPDEVQVLNKQDQVAKLRCNESSKSLDDLRFLGHSRKSKANSNCRSRSSQNLLINALQNSSEKNSSSSLATLVPAVDEFRVRKYSNKSVQVDDLHPITSPEENVTSPKSTLEFLRKICNEDPNGDDSRKLTLKRGSNCSADEESVDGGSFEYVPGSRYNSQAIEGKFTSDTGSKDASSVNTWCSEVTDGVALLTNYVNDLNISNKRQVMEKVAKSLMKNLNRLGKSSMLSTESNERIQPSSIESDCQGSYVKKNSPSGSSQYQESSTSTKNSLFPTSLSEACVSSKDYSCATTGSNSFHSGVSCLLETKSNYKTDSKSDSKSSDSNNETVPPQSFSLKEYLKNEQDVQLLWIKSNINHLNNLRKLWESQKILQKKSKALKKSTSAPRPTRVPSQSETCEPRPSRKRPTIVKNRPILKSDRTFSDRTSNSTTISYGDNGVLSTSGSVNKIPARLFSKGHCDFVQENEHSFLKNEDVCQCACKYCYRKSNKENVPADKDRINQSNKSVPCRRSKFVSLSKQPISYTILFDKCPNFSAEEKNFKIKEYVKRKSMSRIMNQGKQFSRTESITELRRTSNERTLYQTQTVSLQDYLINNKPAYVNRAEYRRQCLAEIAKLRELRDKSREELLAAVRNMDEINDDIVKSVAIPPPLSVVRLFDDKTMKKETEKKYQQLPEVQNKKLESQRRSAYRRNHIMAKVFTKKLQKKVLKGQVNLANTVNVLSV